MGFACILGSVDLLGSWFWGHVISHFIPVYHQKPSPQGDPIHGAICRCRQCVESCVSVLPFCTSWLNLWKFQPTGVQAKPHGCPNQRRVCDTKLHINGHDLWKLNKVRGHIAQEKLQVIVCSTIFVQCIIHVVFVQHELQKFLRTTIRICIWLVLQCAEKDFFGLLAIVCSSWVPVNIATSKRSVALPEGNISLNYVANANCMCSRFLGLQFCVCTVHCHSLIQQVSKFKTFTTEKSVNLFTE